MRYIALLRGINVGGNTMIKMQDLRTMLEGLGFKNVASYINSGNLAFDSDLRSENIITAKIEASVHQHIGKAVHVMIRRQKHIAEVLANNPFDGQFASHKEMHVLFLKEDLSQEQTAALTEMAPKGERFVAVGREIYCHLPMGVAESFLGRGGFEKKLKVSVTARNWRTVEKLVDL